MAPITPNPATTEWVPVWDLNGTGSGSGGGLHHVTHELGGTDVVHLDGSQIVSGTIPDVRLSSNVALKNINNNFSVGQTFQTFTGVSGNNSLFFLNDITGPTDAKYWRILQSSDGILYFQALNDAQTISQSLISIFRDSSILAPGGLRNTPLNASQLTLGTIPDARLSSNVALKDQVNIFTQVQAIVTPSALLHLSDTSQPVDGKVWRIVNVGYLVIQATNDAVTVQQGGVTINRSGVLVAAGLGTTPLDASQLLSGTVPLARLPPFIDQVIGEWLPILGGEGGESGQDYRIQQGRYMRTGKLVHLWGYTQYNGPGGGGHTNAKGIIHGRIVIKNFPFPIGLAPGIGIHPNPLIAGSVAYHTNMYTPQDRTTVLCYGIPGQSYAYILRDVKDGGNPLFLLGDTSPNTGFYDVNDDTQLVIAISYYID
jgi:hypothetical protein